ncbi:aldolase/citrate lyase family protein [Bartonella sp. HY329]|uniref:HpcH/HpaI aldolase family protein n=1 Tax=unclassified Bartonella TaxID=2645622 RepID=UPI0021C679DC|nr:MULTISPECIES: aldolase/citrate lyase family protein [unclassified Bartonella]UXM94418.1 aldolase/citrate lyase family protein [Bartonella sp. HY329]UXN08742.1 aldolase/citrate lyase family protein [Bartonella sp. HY328]
MIKNKLRALWQDNRPVLNGWLSIASPFAAEIMAGQGYDSLTIDMQHGAIGYDQSLLMLQAMRGSEATLMIRVPWLDPADIMKALDAGAYGIICPMINNRAQAEQLVSYMRYPPHGVRSFGPTRALFALGDDYAKYADSEVVCLAMIETQEAFDNLEEIVSVDGVDGVYIGPADLTLGLTGRKYRTGFDREEPELVDAIKHIMTIAHKYGKRACLHNGTPDYAAKVVEWGFDLVTVSNDVRLLAGAASASIHKFRSLIDGNTEQKATSSKSGY